MKKVLIGVVCSALWVCGPKSAVGARGDIGPDCFRRAEKDLHPRDSFTVVTVDSTVIFGTQAMFMASPATLYMRPLVDSTPGAGITLPFDKISTITFTKPSPARGWLVLAGLGVGAAIGGWIGAELAPEPEHWLEFPQVVWGTVGAVVGGGAGAVVAWKCGKHMKVTVTVRCR